MSKDSPLKDMNMQLVQGASDVAVSKNMDNLVEAQAATKVAKHLSTGLAKTFQRRNKEFNTIMDQQLSKEGLSDEEYNALYKKLKRRRGAYVYLNKKQRMDFEREVIQEAGDYKKTEADKDEIADIVTDENNQIDPKDINDGMIEDVVTGKIEPTKVNGRVVYAMNNAELQEFVQEDEEGNPRIASYKEAWGDDRFKVSEDGQFKTDKFGNKYENNQDGYAKFQRDSKLYWIQQAKKSGEKVLHVDSQTGKREYLDPDEAAALLKDEKKHVTMDEIKQHVKGHAADGKASQQLSTFIMSGGQEAQNLKPGDPVKFNFNKAQDKYTKLINSTDPYKLATKKMVGDTSFKDDLKEKLLTMDYKQLGLKDEHIKKLDPTPGDGKVTERDANVITKKIMGNEKMLKTMMTQYFTLYEAREFQKNIPANMKSNPNQGQTDDFQGGTVNSEGVWIPQ